MTRSLNFFTLALIIILTGIQAPVAEISYAQEDKSQADIPQAEKPDEIPKLEVEPESALSEIKLAKPVTYSYVENGHEKQKLDFYRYQSTRPGLRPVLIWFHGGGWVKGSREWIDPIAFEIASVGRYNLISAGYRLADDENAPWPFIIHDVKAVVRWVRFNAKQLRVNPKKIYVGGESAGAHLAAIAALSNGVLELEGSLNPLVSSKVAAAVLFTDPIICKRSPRKNKRQSRAAGARNQIIQARFCISWTVRMWIIRLIT